MAAGDRLFGDLSEAAHGYALGVVAAAGRVRQGELELRLKGDGRPFLDLLRAEDGEGTPAAFTELPEGIRLAQSVAELAARWLGAEPGSDAMTFPVLRREVGWAFVRGLFDAAGHINAPREETLRVRLERLGVRFEEGLLEFLPIAPDRVGRRHLHWSGHNALDLLGHLYEPGPGLAFDGLARPKPRERYLAWTHRVPPFGPTSVRPGPLRWTAVHPDARPPFKQRVTDSGYDLTLLYEKKRHGVCVLYGTGLIVEPPFGWYLDVVPRSSIIKSGYILANNVGVIDRGYRGEILVPLIKIDPDAPDLELPARVVQMVPRPIVHLPLERAEQSTTSHRGAGGFGSTGQ